MKKEKLITAACLFGLLAAGGGVQAAESAGNKPQTVSILFFGDSFMGFGGGLHQHTAGLLKAAGKTTKFNARLYGGTHMGGHYNTPADLRELLEGEYDYLVFVAGCRPGKHPTRRGMMDHYGAKVVDAARAAGVTPVMFMHQEAEKSPMELMQEMIRYHTEFSEQHGILRAPCFPAWLAVLKDRPDFPLWSPDGSHQSLHGCYLNACVLFALLTETSPEGNSYVPAGISPDDAALLQRVAWETWQAVPQAAQVPPVRAPFKIADIVAAEGQDVRITFTLPLHSRTLNSGRWNIPGTEIAGARLSDDARSLILSAPGLSAGKHSLTLSGIAACTPGIEPLTPENPLDVEADADGWRRADIGAVWRPGVFDEKDGVLSLTSFASGKVGSEPADELFFAYRMLEGDGEITARLSAIRETLLPYPYEVVGPKRNAADPRQPDVQARGAAGLMFRFSDSSTAPMIGLAQTKASWGAEEQGVMARVKNGGPSEFPKAGADGGKSRPVIPAPVWMKLTRQGDVFEGFTSSDGVNWVSHGAKKIPAAPPRLLAGLFGYSGQFYTEMTAQFDQVKIQKAE